MSFVQDHPDIEKLPLVIDGIPVRETIREIFRNPENGTPDNISKAGCLALALRSNEMWGRREVGRKYRGYVVWNEWRGKFPVRNLGTENFNFVNFEDHDFRNQPINFSFFKFGDGAKFERTLWGDKARFDESEWGGWANFSGAQWGDGADFSRTAWLGTSIFDNTVWGFGANFYEASWQVRASFIGSLWSAGANFFKASWRQGVDFRGSVWTTAARFENAHSDGCMDFSGSAWGGKADFRRIRCAGLIFDGCSWDRLSGFSLQAAKNWAKHIGSSPYELEEIDFSGATFSGYVSFSNRKFKGVTNFGLLPFDQLWSQQHRHTTFTVAPLFHGCELHQDTSFEGAVFPAASGDEKAIHAYRTLKLAFSKQQAIREEQRFFRLEMEEETLRETGLKRWLFKLYKELSDYGFSAMLPTTYLLLAPFFLMALLYGLIAEVYVLNKYEGLQDIPSSFFWNLLKWSLTSGLPIPGIDVSKELRACLFGAGTALSVLAIIFEMLHKALTFLGLFLIGLALRNLFKLK